MVILEEDVAGIVEKIPPSVMELLAVFLNPNYIAIFGYPFIGGGAVRDALLDRPIKDWDIYFPYMAPSKGAIADIVTALGSKWYTNNVSNTDKAYEGGWMHLHVWTQPNPLTKTNLVDLIFSGQMLSDFDHGICQVGLSFYPSTHIMTTNLFHECVDGQKHIILADNLINPSVCNKSIRNHTPRILAKYPWPVEIRYESDKTLLHL